MYSETPHGAGALGLSELQGRALCLGGPQGQESLQGLQHHHLGYLLQKSYITSSSKVSILPPNILQTIPYT